MLLLMCNALPPPSCLCREVSTCEELRDDDHVWLVTPDREFIWPAFERGTKVNDDSHQLETRCMGEVVS